MNNNTNLGIALTRCFYCLEPSEIVLNTRLTFTYARQVESMNGKVISTEPCAKCKAWMDQGIILMEIDPDKSQAGWEKDFIPNPYRCGGFSVIREDAFRRIFSGPVVDWACRHRWVFIDTETWKAVGLSKAAAEKEAE